MTRYSDLKTLLLLNSAYGSKFYSPDSVSNLIFLDSTSIINCLGNSIKWFKYLSSSPLLSIKYYQLSLSLSLINFCFKDNQRLLDLINLEKPWKEKKRNNIFSYPISKEFWEKTTIQSLQMGSIFSSQSENKSDKLMH